MYPVQRSIQRSIQRSLQEAEGKGKGEDSSVVKAKQTTDGKFGIKSSRYEPPNSTADHPADYMQYASTYAPMQKGNLMSAMRIQTPEELHEIQKLEWSNDPNYDVSVEAEEKVEFRLWQFLREFLFQLFFPLSLPVLLFTEGKVAAASRAFLYIARHSGSNGLGPPANFIMIATWAAAMLPYIIGLLALHANRSTDGLVTRYFWPDVALTCAMYAFWKAGISAKHAVRVPASLPRLRRHAALRDEEMLSGWIPLLHNPDLAKFEIRLAAARVGLDLGSATCVLEMEAPGLNITSMRAILGRHAANWSLSPQREAVTESGIPGHVKVATEAVLLAIVLGQFKAGAGAKRSTEQLKREMQQSWVLGTGESHLVTSSRLAISVAVALLPVFSRHFVLGVPWGIYREAPSVAALVGLCGFLLFSGFSAYVLPVVMASIQNFRRRYQWLYALGQLLECPRAPANADTANSSSGGVTSPTGKPLPNNICKLAKYSRGSRQASLDGLPKRAGDHGDTSSALAGTSLPPNGTESSTAAGDPAPKLSQSFENASAEPAGSLDNDSRSVMLVDKEGKGQEAGHKEGKEGDASGGPTSVVLSLTGANLVVWERCRALLLTEFGRTYVVRIYFTVVVLAAILGAQFVYLAYRTLVAHNAGVGLDLRSFPTVMLASGLVFLGPYLHAVVHWGALGNEESERHQALLRRRVLQWLRLEQSKTARTRWMRGASFSTMLASGTKGGGGSGGNLPSLLAAGVLKGGTNTDGAEGAPTAQSRDVSGSAGGAVGLLTKKAVSFTNVSVTMQNGEAAPPGAPLAALQAGKSGNDTAGAALAQQPAGGSAKDAVGDALSAHEFRLHNTVDKVIGELRSLDVTEPIALFGRRLDGALGWELTLTLSSYLYMLVDNSGLIAMLTSAGDSGAATS
eukprot:jgi/Mesvir1/12645/Mv02201-RA.1